MSANQPLSIAIIGTGNVGRALAKGWAKAGHRILLGVRDLSNFKGKDLLDAEGDISLHSISEAVAAAEVILISAPSKAAVSIANNLGDVSGKVIIDAMNSVFAKPEGYTTTTHALEALTNTDAIVKCFNTTGFENMADPAYGNLNADMFMAGESSKAKEVAKKLALDLGFAECYDFGGRSKYELIEQFAMAWINLAIMQGEGRNIAFKVLQR